MKLCNEPTIFVDNDLDKIRKHYKAEFVVDTEKDGIKCAIFYSEKPHPDSGSRYFALYHDPIYGKLMITSGKWIEEQEFIGVMAHNGDIIFSRHRHDYRTSPDGTVFVDGGRSYIRTKKYAKQVPLRVVDGKLETKKEN